MLVCIYHSAVPDCYAVEIGVSQEHLQGEITDLLLRLLEITFFYITAASKTKTEKNQPICRNDTRDNICFFFLAVTFTSFFSDTEYQVCLFLKSAMSSSCILCINDLLVLIVILQVGLQFNCREKCFGYLGPIFPLKRVPIALASPWFIREPILFSHTLKHMD